MSSSVRAGIAKLYLDERAADVSFSVPLSKNSQETETLPAHKLILSLASDVFKAMFYGELAHEGVVPVPDTTSHTFQALLKFVYTGTLEVNYEDAFDLLYLANKYMTSDLVAAVTSYLERNTSGGNICLALSYGTWMDTELLNRLWKVLDQEATIAICSDYCIEMDKELLLQVVKRDINVDEALLYGRVIAWGKHGCTRAALEVNSANVRAVLGEVLYAIRFPVMKMDEFCKGPALEEYLTAEATAQLLDANHRELASAAQEFQHEGSAGIYSIMFNEPVMAQAGQWYSACIEFDAKYRTLDGCGGMRKVAVTGDGSTTITFSFKSCAGAIDGATGSTIEEGQVPEIFFSVD